MSAIDDMDPDDGRVVYANGGAYYVYKLPNNTQIDDIDLSEGFLILIRVVPYYKSESLWKRFIT